MESIQDLLAKHGFKPNYANSGFIGMDIHKRSVTIPADELSNHTVETFKEKAMRKGWFNANASASNTKDASQNQFQGIWGLGTDWVEALFDHGGTIEELYATPLFRFVKSDDVDYAGQPVFRYRDLDDPPTDRSKERDVHVLEDCQGLRLCLVPPEFVRINFEVS